MERTELESNYFIRVAIRARLYLLRRTVSKMKDAGKRKEAGRRWANGSWNKYVDLGNKIEFLRLKLESQEYIDFYLAKNKFHDHMLKLRCDRKIPDCLPRPLEYYGEKAFTEQYNYLLMEIFEGKHNNFLQTLINNTNKD